MRLARRQLKARLWLRLASAADTGARWLDDAARVGRFPSESSRFIPREDDVFVASYPRSGTTWMQAIVYLLHLPEGAPLRFGFEHIDDVVPWYERSLSVGTRRAADFEAMLGPRCFKTHLVPRLMPAGGRVILMRRNALDVGLSYHRLYADYLGFTGSAEAFFERFLQGRVQYGAPAAHWAAWQRREGPLLEVAYEQLRAQPQAQVERVAAFLGLPSSPSRIEAVVQASDIEAMRAAQDKFDHATAMLRERGVRARNFIRDGQGGARSSSALESIARRIERGEHADARAPLHSFLR